MQTEFIARAGKVVKVQFQALDDEQFWASVVISSLESCAGLEEAVANADRAVLALQARRPRTQTAEGGQTS
jgi:hypothetical protein